ncbi:uncharacterized protein SCHCODRAFT_01314122 [Schizophyllum commune H4-8]|uniref:uncharacterized protein n=1 Tax=Schizophyllum commune (strain H4-8 / FGSC 9210) TaxID=578458 RepID=UPI00215F43D0|nr:uncharacterized protein SCHCODRAFT_01314122 [Schizophyllum commune H4-8]KAI5889925.1 hypothetical protein SCHCODRAFT_01314122 [Schizophyllum commune H4-8]
MINCLVHRGASLEARNEDGWTPLFLAVIYSRERAVAMLLTTGADPKTRANDGVTLLGAVGRSLSERLKRGREIAGEVERDSRIRISLVRAGSTEGTGRNPSGDAWLSRSLPNALCPGF